MTSLNNEVTPQIVVKIPRSYLEMIRANVLDLDTDLAWK